MPDRSSTTAADIKMRVDRRSFLSTAAVGTLATALLDRSASAGSPVPRQPSSGALLAARPSLRPLAPGAIKPAGWLALYLNKQANQLGGHLPEVSSPFTGEHWSGEETPPETNGWWPWEQKAYWIDGALRCALVLGDKTLIAKASKPVEFTLTHAGPDGYLGPRYAQLDKASYPHDGNLRWSHTVFFRALMALSDARRDRAIPQALRKHYLGDAKRVPYGALTRDVTNVEVMLWTYERTGDKRLLEMAEKAWAEFQLSAPPGERESGDLHPDRVFAKAPIHAHGVTYAEKSKLPAILYMHTGKEDYLRFALAAQERVFARYMLIDGVPSASEHYRGISPNDAHESCDITDHCWTWFTMLQATGDGIWADRIERAVLNGGFGAIRKDWKGVQYFSCPNQVIATLDSSHVPYIEESHSWMAYRPNPGQDVACCGGNIHRFFPNHVLGMWLKDQDGGLVAAQYGPSRLETVVGTEQIPVQVEQETHYPFDEVIQLAIRAAKPVSFALSLRIPGWCNAPRVALNGQALALPPVKNGFVRIERRFNPDDRITLTLPMTSSHSFWPDGGVGFEHGPLVYSLPVEEAWTSRVIAPWSTDAFPDWEARPNGNWNYGVATNEQRKLPPVEVVRKPMTDDPWVDPPVMLRVNMKPLPGWELASDPQFPKRQLTPALPEVGLRQGRRARALPPEAKLLKPYGSTHLRLTIFPAL